MFVNYLEAHGPYDPPEEFRRLFLEGPLRSALALLRDDWYRAIYRYMGIPRSLEPADYGQLADLYDAEIAYQDSRLRGLVTDFGRRGLLDDTLIVVVGDHGENLGEHDGLLAHNFSVHQSVLRVPLLVRYPRMVPEGETYSRPVSTIGVFSTILDMTGVGSVQGWTPQVAALPLGDDDEAPPFIISEYDLPVAELGRLVNEVPGFDVRPLAVSQRAIQDDAWKLVRRSDGIAYLFHLAEDPLELVRLDPRGFARGDALLQGLKEWELTARTRRVHSTVEIRPVDKATRESLKALGYVN
jgi:arylsulfatase A-like enzyme